MVLDRCFDSNDALARPNFTHGWLHTREVAPEEGLSRSSGMGNSRSALDTRRGFVSSFIEMSRITIPTLNGWILLSGVRFKSLRIQTETRCLE